MAYKDVYAIQTAGLTKNYGKSRGITDVTLEVATGEIFGFLGPNGAGKTTAIRLMLDFIRPTSGSMRTLGLEPRKDGPSLRAKVGYLSGEMALYNNMTGHA